eukprot:TRINITY_DN4195_c0_g1_i1.p1 TRINITY_DN4195_c0_g1~~TRINITY_DN4195_c0_g1_i1.p1  ORF type:complete len:113 (+),score=13.69 TRINITY_DN4195_c0_g1_i1:86-424(+)
MFGLGGRGRMQGVSWVGRATLPRTHKCLLQTQSRNPSLGSKILHPTISPSSAIANPSSFVSLLAGKLKEQAKNGSHNEKLRPLSPSNTLSASQVSTLLLSLLFQLFLSEDGT